MAARDDQLITSAATVDTTPLLQSSGEASNDAGGRQLSPRRGMLSRVIRMMSGRSNRRVMREPSVLVRETAAEHLEERQSDWAYSKPVVILDLLWNLTFITVALTMLILSRNERPSNPLRLWIVVYAAQCCVHMACVLIEYRRRRHQDVTVTASEASQRESSRHAFSYPERPQIDGDSDQPFDEFISPQISLAKRIESANTSFSFIWWVVGFYWTTTGTQSQSAPLLFWLCVAFLAFDVFFVVFCISLACMIGLAVCCCLPCIIAIMYAVAEQEGASEEDIDVLPKYTFRRNGNIVNAGELGGPSGGVMTMAGTSSAAAVERVLLAENAECCICLSSYDDGVELRELPCGHHFHCTCIDRWLRMNSTCPLCKFNVSKGHNIRNEDV